MLHMLTIMVKRLQESCKTCASLVGSCCFILAQRGKFLCKSFILFYFILLQIGEPLKMTNWPRSQQSHAHWSTIDSIALHKHRQATEHDTTTLSSSTFSGKFTHRRWRQNYVRLTSSLAATRTTTNQDDVTVTDADDLGGTISTSRTQNCVSIEGVPPTNVRI